MGYIHYDYQTEPRELPVVEKSYLPGEKIGYHLPYNQLAVGIVVTCVHDSEQFGGCYYYDPDLKIEGSHWLKPATKSGWIKISRKGLGT